jgi:hypothetical protein
MECFSRNYHREALEVPAFSFLRKDMIISNTHHFVFVHIPKCAGTTVRHALQVFDDCNGAHTDRVGKHPVLGNLDYVHIPLFTLRDHFKEEFKAVKDYWSFAVVRDPFTRFASSISQRMKMYSDQPMHRSNLGDVSAAIDESIEYLSQQSPSNHRLPPEYIHFQKQIDYIELDGEQIVDSLYTLNDVDKLFKEVGQFMGCSIGCRSQVGGTQPRINQSIVFRNDLIRWAIETTRPLLNQSYRLLPEGVKQRVRDQIYVPRDHRMKDLFTADHVQNFIQSYYTKDIALYKKINHTMLSNV